MTYAANHRDFASCRGDRAFAKSYAVANKAGLLRSILDAIFESPQKQTDREIARFIARSGGRMTDNMEREMMQRAITGHWNARW